MGIKSTLELLLSDFMIVPSIPNAVGHHVPKYRYRSWQLLWLHEFYEYEHCTTESIQNALP